MSDRHSATQTGGQGRQVPDRIFVRDFIKEVEIGAFQAERDVVQRIMFNVVLDVVSGDAAQVDDVDMILSYDAITDAIDHQLGVERLNLLETLAERIAAEILQHAHALSVIVRIEKLDRIPGSLGIEIQRDKDQIDTTEADHVETRRPIIAVLPNTQTSERDLTHWINSLMGLNQPVVICLEADPVQPAMTGVAVPDRRIGLLSIEQNAWRVASNDAGCTVVDSRTELDWAIQNGLLAIWAPARMIMDAVDGDDLSAGNPQGLARWLANQLGVQHVHILGADANVTDAGLLRIENPNDLVAIFGENGFSPAR